MTQVVDLRSGATAAPSTTDDARWHLSSIEQVDRALHGGPAVAMVCWPAEAAAVERLAELGLPRLLLVGPDDEPVEHLDVLEDWVRIPVRDDDALARIRRLRESAQRVPSRPLLADDGRLIYDGRWVSLPLLDERVARPLVAAYPDAVDEDVLLEAGWPGEAVPHATLRPRISRLRRRLGPIGLRVVALHGIGYALQRAPDGSQQPLR